MEIKIFISPFLLYAFNNLVIKIGSPVTPNKVPLIKTLVMFLLGYILKSSNLMTPISLRHLLISSTLVPAVILVNNARFLRYPIDAPSGLSNGHIIPHCCECNL